MTEQLIGTVTHYFSDPHVAVVKVTGEEVAVGDEVHFLGHTTDFAERVSSLELDHTKVERGGVGAEIAIQVVERVREHDKVFKVT